uniref:Elicitorlike mating protein M81 putative n=1 Tax=Albugo laibachii Nc14 TaxID=890382 RepID=F0W0T2_9STRA|nr:elicitorlike mating protein M81 putative [Albugo laibachii Nc14]|eukprot:CCA14656.1 elicitorlike mating protein M81 putative [Albugo laibachii Nc14]
MAFTLPRALICAIAGTFFGFNGPMTIIQASPMSQEPRYESISLINSKSPQYGAELRCDSSELKLVLFDIKLNLMGTLDNLKLNVTGNLNNGKKGLGSLSLGKLVRRLVADSDDSVARFEKHVGSVFTRSFPDLMKYKSAQVNDTPWSGDYYPAALDSINNPTRAGDKSPSQKYAEGFNLSAEVVVAQVSAAKGAQHYINKNFSRCRVDADCDQSEKRKCTYQYGTNSTGAEGVCIQKWAGICHAWSIAAIFEAQPKCPVVVGNVEFSALDVQALLIYMYDEANAETVIAGARFDPGMDDTKDSHNRPNSPVMRDINAGSFLVILVNMIGVLERSFVGDVTQGIAVWNHPIVSYEITVVQPVDEPLLQKFYGVSKYPYNDDATSLMYLEVVVTWVVENMQGQEYDASGKHVQVTNKHTQKMIIELDTQQNVIGGEHLDDHFDYIWLDKTHLNEDTVGAGGFEYKFIKKLLVASQTCTKFE